MPAGAGELSCLEELILGDSWGGCPQLAGLPWELLRLTKLRKLDLPQACGDPRIQFLEITKYVRMPEHIIIGQKVGVVGFIHFYY